MVIQMRYPEGRSKALTFSYDDGPQSDERLVRIFREHGLRGTFNLNSGVLFPEGAGSSADEKVHLYRDAGQEVAVHGFLHRDWSQIPLSGVAYEIVKDRERLESRFGVIVRGMAYPNGAFSEQIAACAKSCGIAYGRTTVSSRGFQLPENWMMFHPTCHHGDPKLGELTDAFLNREINPVWNRSILFTLWGHSYEFDSGKSWNTIENFAEKVSGRNEIWYATNLEICDYVGAYGRLLFSADLSVVHNPTDTDLWLMKDGKTIFLPKNRTAAIL